MTVAQTLHLHPFAENEQTVTALAHKIHQIVGRRRDFRFPTRIVLAGGETPIPLYRKLLTLDFHWPDFEFFFSDERCFPEGHPDLNYSKIHREFFAPMALPPSKIHPIPAHLGPFAGAKTYESTIRQVPHFDIAILGMGEDGHVASIFPGLAGDSFPTGDSPEVIAVERAPKPPTARISLSLKSLSRAESIFFLLLGPEKIQPLEKWLAGENLPPAKLMPQKPIEIFLTTAKQLNIIPGQSPKVIISPSAGPTEHPTPPKKAR